MSAKGIPQIAAVMGSCTAGGAYVPAMSDEAVIVKGTGHDLPGRAAAGQGRHRRGRHRRRAGRRRRAHPPLRRGRPLCRGRRARPGNLPQHRRDPAAARSRSATCLDALDVAPPEEPLYPPEEIYGILPHTFRESYDVREIIARLVDGSRFREFKARYGTTLVCGFARIFTATRWASWATTASCSAKAP